MDGKILSKSASRTNRQKLRFQCFQRRTEKAQRRSFSEKSNRRLGEKNCRRIERKIVCLRWARRDRYENFADSSVQYYLFCLFQVTNILSAFNVWEEQFPDYAVTAILELSQHKQTKEYGVEVSDRMILK